MLGNVWDRVRGVLAPKVEDATVNAQLGKLREQTPVPVFWLIGKTQTGKTSVIRFLTGAERAEIGKGFQPCTRFSSLYDFPDEQSPLLRFLDTRGLDEPGYDPAEDVAAFDDRAHVVIVTVKLLDHAQENLVSALKRVRAARPGRPVVLLVTCLHEAYPQQQHPTPYPFDDHGHPLPGRELPSPLVESLEAHRKRFSPLVDRIIPIDLTPPEEGFTEPEYGGEVLRRDLLDLLPAAQAQTLRALELAHGDLYGLYEKKAMPTIIAYTSMAATAGALPIPIVDTALLAGVQSAMLHQLARLYGQPLTTQRMGELVGALGMGFLGRAAGRSLIKFIPIIGQALGAVSGAILAAASTYALGKAFCVYYKAVIAGEVPDPASLKGYYEQQFAAAKESWTKLRGGEKKG